MLYLAQFTFISTSISNSKTFQQENNYYFAMFLEPLKNKKQNAA